MPVADEDVVVDDRGAAAGHRAGGQLLVAGHADLAHHEDVEGRAEAPRHLGRHDHTAPGEAEHDDVVPLAHGAQGDGEAGAGVDPVAEGGRGHPPMVRRPAGLDHPRRGDVRAGQLRWSTTGVPPTRTMTTDRSTVGSAPTSPSTTSRSASKPARRRPLRSPTPQARAALDVAEIRASTTETPSRHKVEDGLGEDAVALALRDPGVVTRR